LVQLYQSAQVRMEKETLLLEQIIASPAASVFALKEQWSV
jgi:hypothetical protein